MKYMIYIWEMMGRFVSNWWEVAQQEIHFIPRMTGAASRMWRRVWSLLAGGHTFDMWWHLAIYLVWWHLASGQWSYTLHLKIGFIVSHQTFIYRVFIALYILFRKKSKLPYKNWHVTILAPDPGVNHLMWRMRSRRPFSLPSTWLRCRKKQVTSQPPTFLPAKDREASWHLADIWFGMFYDWYLGWLIWYFG